MNQSLPRYQPDISKTMVIFGCHPDDAECMAGGLTTLHTQAGGKAVFIHQAPVKPETELAAHRAAEILGAKAAFFHTHGFDVTEEAVDILHTALEQFRPAHFIDLWPIEMHPQHSAMAWLCFRAALEVIGGGDTKLREENVLWFGELNPGVCCRSFNPNIWVDITNVADLKWQAMGEYADGDGTAETGIKNWGWWGQNQTTVEQFRGFQCGCRRAEAFVAYGGWDESPLDRPWGIPMFPGRNIDKPWWDGKQTYAKVNRIYLDY